MAFCTKCGKALAEGEVCSCQNTPNQVTSATQAASQTAAQAVAPQPAVPQRTIFTDMKDLIVGVFKAPVEEVEKYIKSKDIAVACILIAVYALIAGLQELLYYATSSYDHSTKVIVSAFFDDTLSILAIALLFAAIVWFILKYVFKIEASFSQCLCIYSLKSVVIVPAKIIYTILTMFHVSFITEVGSWFTSFASAFAAILVFFGVRTLCKKENSIPTVVGVAAIGTSLASYIIGLLF